MGCRVEFRSCRISCSVGEWFQGCGVQGAVSWSRFSGCIVHRAPDLKRTKEREGESERGRERERSDIEVERGVGREEGEYSEQWTVEMMQNRREEVAKTLEEKNNSTL